MEQKDVHIEQIQDTLDEQAEKLDEGMRISVCSRCGHYPKLVFNEGRNCATGICFRRFIKEQIAEFSKEPEDVSNDS